MLNVEDVLFKIKSLTFGSVTKSIDAKCNRNEKAENFLRRTGTPTHQS